MLKTRIPTKGLEYFDYFDDLYAIIIRDEYESSTIQFFTEGTFSQQLGFLPHKAGKIIEPHVHKPSKREVIYTHEVLFVKKGRVLVNFYDTEKAHIGSTEIKRGDTILLCGGGHGFKILEEAQMIEVKQGPFMGEQDKERFKGVES